MAQQRGGTANIVREHHIFLAVVMGVAGVTFWCFVGLLNGDFGAKIPVGILRFYL